MIAPRSRIENKYDFHHLDIAMNDLFRNWLDRLAAACGYYTAADMAMAKRVAETRISLPAEPTLAGDPPDAAVERQEQAMTKRTMRTDGIYYFVSFSHAGGFGSLELCRTRPITNWDDIEGMDTCITEFMRREYGSTDPRIAILNWQRFERAPKDGAREPIPLADGADRPADNADNIVLFRRVA